MKVNTKEYDKDKVLNNSGIPPAGAIVKVEVMPESIEGQDWAGTRERKSRKGSDMLQVHAEVCEGEQGDGAWLLDYIVYDTPYTTQNVCSILDGLGFAVDEGLVYDFTPSLIIGRKGYVKIKHEEYDGKTCARIAYWISQSRYNELALPPIVQAADGTHRKNPAPKSKPGPEGCPF